MYEICPRGMQEKYVYTGTFTCCFYSCLNCIITNLMLTYLMLFAALTNAVCLYNASFFCH